jgi:LruC domain-containing protein
MVLKLLKKNGGIYTMKKNKSLIWLFIILSFALAIVSCSTSDNNVTETKEMTDLVIADDFSFTTHRDVEVTFRALYAGVFYIYDMEDNLIKKGLIDLNDGYHGIVSIPNDVNDVKLRFSEVEDLEDTYTITGDIIEYDFYPLPEERERATRCEDQIHPILECIEHLGDGLFLAHYGYRNDYDIVQQIPIGPMNKLQNTPNQDMGQPTVFQPGRHENVFTVEYPGDGYRDDEIFYIKWKLGGSLGEGFARADSTSTECPRGIFDDDDNDGVLNDDDDFQYDETRAFRHYYPVADDSLAMGTLAFEDRWPLMGDYDFNDVIINYRFETVGDPNDDILEVYGYFTLRASGASYENSFAIEIPFLESNVETLTYTDLPGASVIAGDDSEIIKFFSNALEVMNKPENSTFVNTQTSDPYLEPVNFEFYLKLNEAVNDSTLTWRNPPYNPFIIVDQITGKEIHLPDMPPTIFADRSLFGTDDDDSDSASDRYYKTAINLPWAINLPIEWTYPLERIVIIEAYNYFDDWAESSGGNYNDWFENNEGYIVEENLYINP